jgi:hypothetical protein
MRKYLLSAAFVGVIANLAVAAAAPPSESLTITARPNPVVFGLGVRLSGRLTGADPAGKTVQVEGDPFPYDGDFTTRAQAVTAADGSWSTALAPGRNTRYRARRGSTRSGIVTALVRIRVSLKLSDYTPRSGQLVKFFGQACPRHDGALVRIQRLTRTREWRTVRRTTLRAPLVGHLCSRYSRRFRVFRDGTFRAFVVSPDDDHENGRSHRRHVNAH